MNARFALAAPADATDITVRTSTLDDAADAVILLSSDSALPDDCTEADRYSAPSWALDDAPTPTPRRRSSPAATGA